MSTSWRLYEKIAHSIEEQIRNGEITPGEKLLSERELCEKYGVSRTAVREAVKALREKGLVEVQPGRGTFVSNNTTDVMTDFLDTVLHMNRSDDILDHLLEVRNILEPEIAALAAKMATPDDMVRLQQIVVEMDEIVISEQKYDSDLFIEANVRFHRALADATQNPILSTLTEPINRLIRQQRAYRRTEYQGAVHAQEGHKSILKSIERRSSDAARAWMHAHIDQIRTDETT